MSLRKRVFLWLDNFLNKEKSTDFKHNELYLAFPNELKGTLRTYANQWRHNTENRFHEPRATIINGNYDYRPAEFKVKMKDIQSCIDEEVREIAHIMVYFKEMGLKVRFSEILAYKDKSNQIVKKDNKEEIERSKLRYNEIRANIMSKLKKKVLKNAN